MLGKFSLGAIGCVIAVFAACSENSEGGRRTDGTGAGVATGGDATTSGGSAGSSVSGAGAGGQSTGGKASTGGSGGSRAMGGASTSGAAGNDGGGDDGITDAGLEDAPDDAPSDGPEPPQCLGSGDACGDDAGTCCEAYACRDGKCCMPNGVWSNCLTNTDCCSNSCILNQCTCVPRGYSCTGSGQCCSGFACVNGTCICPPDIRGC